MKLLIIIPLFLLISCSNNSKNMVSHWETYFRGGVYKKDLWEDKILFKRTSWFKELTLLFDVLTYKVEKGSPFNKWFSKREQDFVKSCDEFFVTLSYRLDSDRISKAMFFNQISSQEYEKIAIPEFKSHIKLHPDYENLSFQLYDVNGICKKSGAKSGIVISFPGFRQTNL